MRLMLSMSMLLYLFSFGVETDYIHFDLNGDIDLNFHSWKINIKGRGNVTEPEMCSVWLKNSISYNLCQYSFVIASVGFNIDVWLHNIHQNV